MVLDEVYHYTTLRNLEKILKSGGNFWPTRGRYDPKKLKYYFTDLPPETSNSDLKRYLYGSGMFITHDGTGHLIRGQAYFYLKVDGKALIRSDEEEPQGRQHVYYILASSQIREFEILECGQRTGWQTGKKSGRERWDLIEKGYRGAFMRKLRYRFGKFFLKGLKRRK